jgi:hypothetical protein
MFGKSSFVNISELISPVIAVEEEWTSYSDLPVVTPYHYKEKTYVYCSGGSTDVTFCANPEN